MVRVLLADDHNLVRTGIKRLLMEERGVEVVAEAKSGEDAITLARETMPEVILMDVSMPGIGGLEATRKLLRINPEFKVIVVSVHVDGPIPARMLEAGAVGYLTKGCEPEEMIRAIRSVEKGQQYVSAEVAQQMVLHHFDGSKTPIDSLSRRELQVMLMVSQGQNIREISKKLCLSPKTISTYRTRLLKKLGAHTDVELTHLALRHGLIEPRGSTGAP